MGKVRVLVVEDEVIIADNISDTLEEFGYEVQEPASTYREALESIKNDPPDIAILDIQLTGNKTGVDLATYINEQHDFPFIFLSSNTDKITLDEAKRVEPLAYLVKPFNRKELYTSIEVALYNYSKRKEQALDQQNLVIKDALFIKSNKAFQRINFTDILYLKSDHVYLDIATKEGQKYTVRGSLNDYMSKLGPTFFRTHRSCVVNLDYLDQVNHSDVCIQGTAVAIGKKQRDELLERLNRG